MTARFSPDQFGASPASPADTWREYADELKAQTIVLRPSAAVAAPAQPARDEVFVPDHYERNYAYPLIVWLLPADAPKGQLQRLMRQLSDRSYFGMALRCEGSDLPEARLHDMVACLRRRWHLHTERVILAGHNECAAMALSWGLSRPEWFGGVIALSPEFKTRSGLLSRFDKLRGKRVFLGSCARDAGQSDRQIDSLHRLLWSAGLSVGGCQSESHDATDGGILRAVDHWLISGIDQPEAAA